MFEEGCIAITGAVIDGDYRDYPNGGLFSPDGDIIDNDRKGHPIFTPGENEKIQIEIQGDLDIERTTMEYLTKYSTETTHFGTI